MAGTRLGGLKAQKTNTERHGKDYYKEIGRKGGLAGHTGGFKDLKLARLAGEKGGRASKRGPAAYSQIACARANKHTIFRMIESGRTYREIGAKFGISPTILSKFVRGERGRND